jgi:hypothetical protein
MQIFDKYDIANAREHFFHLHNIHRINYNSMFDRISRDDDLVKFLICQKNQNECVNKTIVIDLLFLALVDANSSRCLFVVQV